MITIRHDTRANSGRNAFAAERRRNIFELATRMGSVNVSELAELMHVTTNTVRNDLDILEKEGKLVRSHGGAMIKDAGNPLPPYSQTRGAHMVEKAWIGSTALNYIPDTGSLFIGGGSTTYQMVTRMSENSRLRVVTNAPAVAVYLASNALANTYMLGGHVQHETLSVDSTWCPEVLDRLHFDFHFAGVEAIDVERGITCSDEADEVALQTKMIELSGKLIVLCDSSKIGRVAYMRVCPVSSIDVLITDPNVERGIVEELTQQGVEVVIAGPHGPNDDPVYPEKGGLF
ncbi:MAG: DeoR/GlpR family DNA-binding transcription regulator [Armatimonadetes bacterium]|nr:DeoR/GlpR family DNA-binding transcription regulator [Armatimonadota bacterium]